MRHLSPDLFAHTHAVDFILVVIVIEVILLSAMRRYSFDRMINIAFAVAPGVCLLLALRAALAMAGWIWIAIFLAASFPIHLGDLMRRRL